MPSATLVVGFLVNLAAATMFAYVGSRFLRTEFAGHARLAGRAFGVWWLCIAAFTLLWSALPMGLVVAGVTRLSLFLMLLYVAMFFLCLGIGGLVFYLLYLLTGKRHLVGPVAVYYAGIFVLSIAVFSSHRPVDVAIHQWWVDLVYQTPLGTDYKGLLAMTILPAVAAASLYLTLVKKTPEPLMKLRISVLSSSIIVWGLASMIARIYEADWWQLVARTVLGFVAATLILFAYEVPVAYRRRLGQHTERQEQHLRRAQERDRVQEMRRQERERALRARMEDLV